MRAALGRILTHLWGALAWRIRRMAGDAAVDRTIEEIARRWRPVLKKPVFIGITGSAGKTTTKELLLGILASKSQGIGSPASLNKPTEVAKTILRVRPAHEFCIAELSEDRPGALDQGLTLLQPGVGIVTVVGNDHWSAYGSREAIAREMGKLVESLPATGVAVLNADDRLVRAMAEKCAARVITYGFSPDADLRAEATSSAWPDRLRLTVVYGSDRVKIATQLCGSHWIPSVMSAIAAGVAVGASLDECAKGIASVAPFEGRMQPVTTPEGVTFIRDDWKAPLWTVDGCFEFMKEARASRKIVVIGTLSDCGAGAPEKYIKVARRAQEIADITIFVGPWGSQVLKARKPGAEEALRFYRNVRDAAEFINGTTHEGDLVLLKGTNKQDHLLRVIMRRTQEIACWRDDCERHSFCHECPDRSKPSGLPVLMAGAPRSAAAAHLPPTPQLDIGADEQVIAGLGNPEPRYVGTPHNVGHEVVERIAVTLGLRWETTPEAWVARGSANGRSVCLVKIQAAMNLTGAGLKRLSENLSFGPEQCILVHDDLDMPLGSVRTRLSGGAGGHRGVASVLEAFQTDSFRRVKIGVGQAEARGNRVEYVLTPFAAANRDAIDSAIASAAKRALEMVERSGVTKELQPGA